MINRFLPTPFRVKTEANVKNVYVDNERKLLYILTFNSNVEVEVEKKSFLKIYSLFFRWLTLLVMAIARS